MKHLLITTIAAVVLVGCGPSVDIWTAAKTGNIEAVKQHLAAGADVNAKDGIGGTTPLHKAAHFRRREVVELLIDKGADVNVKGTGGLTPLHIAKTKEITELLITNGADVNAKSNGGGTPLHQAAGNSHKEVAQLLISKGADVNAKTKRGETPLDQAKRHPETAALLRKHGGKTGEELKAEGK